MFEELHLSGETRTKTKNNLIYKNNVMGITIEQVEEKLRVLSDLLKKDADTEAYRETMLEIIKDDRRAIG